jgi:hypothetical protein
VERAIVDAELEPASSPASQRNRGGRADLPFERPIVLLYRQMLNDKIPSMPSVCESEIDGRHTLRVMRLFTNARRFRKWMAEYFLLACAWH